MKKYDLSNLSIKTMIFMFTYFSWEISGMFNKCPLRKICQNTGFLRPIWWKHRKYTGQRKPLSLHIVEWS